MFILFIWVRYFEWHGFLRNCGRQMEILYIAKWRRVCLETLVCAANRNVENCNDVPLMRMFYESVKKTFHCTSTEFASLKVFAALRNGRAETGNSSNKPTRKCSLQKELLWGDSWIEKKERQYQDICCFYSIRDRNIQNLKFSEISFFSTISLRFLFFMSL